MKKEEGKRRSFLKHVLAGSAVVAGAAMIVRPAKAKTAKPQMIDQEDVLYHESEEFKKYYKSLS